MQHGNGARRWRRPILPAILALCAVVTGTSRVAVDFQPVRQRLVTADTRPEPGRPIVLAVPASTQPLSVVVLRARGGLADATLAVRENGRLLAQAILPAGKTRRLDVQSPAGLAPGARLELSCDAAGWTLLSLEVGNRHGHSSGLFNAHFLPASRRDYRTIPAWLMVVVGAVLFLLRARPQGRVRPIEHVLAGAGLLLLTLSLVSPLVSSYAVVLSVSTFLLGLGLVFGLPAWRACLALRARIAAAREVGAYAVDGTLVVALVLGFFVAATGHGLRVQGGDYEGFLYLSDRFAAAPVLDEHPELRQTLRPLRSGYDGQFMYLMAFDPLLARLPPARYRDVVDSPPYRYGRIGFSLLTLVFSGGNPAAFPRTMVWLIVAAHVASAGFLVLIARHHRAPAWQVLPYLLIPGFLVSLGRALPESVAGALLLAGLWSHLRSRTAAAIVLWSLSLLVRETGAILIAAIAVGEWLDRHDWKRAGRLLLAAIPVVLWRVYVGVRLAPDYGMRAWWDDPRDITFPFVGFFRLWAVNDAAHGFGQPYNVWFPLILVALLALAVLLFRARPAPVAGAAVAYAALAVSLDYRQIWAWIGNGERGTFEAFLMVLVATLPFGPLPRVLRWGLAAFALVLFVYDFQIGTHAGWFRSALVVFG